MSCSRRDTASGRCEAPFAEASLPLLYEILRSRGSAPSHVPKQCPPLGAESPAPSPLCSEDATRGRDGFREDDSLCGVRTQHSVSCHAEAFFADTCPVGRRRGASPPLAIPDLMVAYPPRAKALAQYLEWKRCALIAAARSGFHEPRQGFATHPVRAARTSKDCIQQSLLEQFIK
jgi:hypothetical protein